ncbi:MBL fold metallo-hydrolase [Patescibacteria group bacterium]
MQIFYLGHSCFKLQNNNVTLITDPFDKTVGLKVPNIIADIATVSHEHKDHNNTSAVKCNEVNPFVINMPGEYEVKGVFVYGIPCYHDDKNGEERGLNTIYRIEMDGVNICHLGDLGHLLTDAELSKIGNIDVLMIPVGGKFTIGAKEASAIINQMEPRIVIPMHYKMNKTSSSLGLDSIEPFLKEMGISNPEITTKLKISKKDLPQGAMEIVVMGE